jgi:UPF0755 protein
MTKIQKLYLIGSPLLALIFVAMRIYYLIAICTYQGPDRTFDILPGENFSRINTHLHQEKIISSARMFHRYSQFKGVLNKFKTGRYKIHHGANLLDVFNALIVEKSMVSLFTVPEGKNMYEIGKMLEESEIVKASEFISACKDKSLVLELGIDGDTLEGYLYPETYDFMPGINAISIARLMVKEFHKKTHHIDFTKSHLNKKEIITLASMVEKETGDKKERPMIAGVFLNRLKIHMRLQSDPTTVYGIFEKYNGNITKKDLLAPSDYNTYTLQALPKGPIANPGVLSIEAVLKPLIHRYLYFVSQNDGTHIFSENYDDHRHAVNIWQKNSMNREGRSWRQHKN